MKITCVRTDNCKKGKYAIYYGCWPTRVLKHRGWERVVFFRPAALSEIEYQNKCMRMVAYRYVSWSLLAKDECRLGFNANWLRHKFLYGRAKNIYNPTLHPTYTTGPKPNTE